MEEIKNTSKYDSLGLNSLQIITVQELTQKIFNKGKNILNDTWEIGKLLTQVKNEIVDHGNFGKYLNTIVQIPHRTANEWMTIYQSFPDGVTNMPGLQLTAAKEIARKGFDPERRDAILEKAKAGEKITIKEVRNIYNEIVNPTEEMAKQQNKINRKLLEIADKRIKPDHENSNKLPGNVKFMIGDTLETLRGIRDNYFDIVVSCWLYQATIDIKAITNQINRVLTENGDFILVTTHNWLQFLHNKLGESGLQEKALIVSQLKHILKVEPNINNNYIMALWLTKDYHKEHKPISDLIISDAEIKDGNIHVGLNEFTYLIEQLAPLNGKVLNIYPGNGAAVEAAHIAGCSVDIIADTSTSQGIEEVNGIIYRMSGYAD